MMQRSSESPSTNNLLETVARAIALGVALSLAGAAGAASQSAPQAVKPGEVDAADERGIGERFLVRLDLRATRYSNYFRVPDDLPQVDVREDLARARLDYLIGGDRRRRVYGEIGVSQYDRPELENSPRSRLGFRSAGRRQGIDTSISYVGNGRELDLNEAVRASDIWSWLADYHYRFNDSWQLGGRAALWRQNFSDGTPDIDTNELGLSLRYRGFGRKFSPELGYRQRRSSGGLAGQADYDEDFTFLKLRFRPVDVLSLSLRYRIRDRVYDTNDPGSSNFDRRDERDKWTLVANASLLRNLALNLTYNRIDGRSTRPDRDFDSADLGLMLSLTMNGG